MKCYNFGYLSTDDQLKGNDSIHVLIELLEFVIISYKLTINVSSYSQE